MADLQTGFPSWITPRQWQKEETGVGQRFLQGMQLGARMGEQQREQEYRDKVLQLQRDSFELKKTADLNQSEGMVEIGKTLSEIATAKLWDQPEGEQKFWDTVAKYPSLRLMPSFDNLANMFPEARKARAMAEKGFAPGPLEKDIEYYRRVQAEGDPAITDLVRSTLESRAQKRGFSVKFGPDGKVESVDYGTQATGATPNAPTTAFRTQLQQQLHAYNTSMASLDHIEKNISASDFGIRGMAKELRAKIGGQLGLNIDPKDMDVRNSLKQLRQDLFKALRSDGNIAEPERKLIEGMLPEVEMFDVLESLPSAVGKLMTVKRRLRDASRSAAQKLGVLPPLSVLSNDEIAEAVKQNKLDKQEAMQFLMEYR